MRTQSRSAGCLRLCLLAFFCVAVVAAPGAAARARIARAEALKQRDLHMFGRTEGTVAQLHEELRKRSWQVVATVNDGFFDFFLNWCYYYEKLSLAFPVLVLAEDDEVYSKLQKLDCKWLTIRRTGLNLRKDLTFGSQKYKKMVSQRAAYLLAILEQGKDLLYTDIDTVLLKDPSPFFTGDRDAWIQMDGEGEGDARPYYCTGFMAVIANDRTKKLMRAWDTEMKKHPQTNQPIFNRILHHKSTVRHAALPELFFPNGREYFTEFTDELRARVALVHNNWISGGNAKRKRFKDKGLWHPDEFLEAHTR